MFPYNAVINVVCKFTDNAVKRCLTKPLHLAGPHGAEAWQAMWYVLARASERAREREREKRERERERYPLTYVSNILKNGSAG